MIFLKTKLFNRREEKKVRRQFHSSKLFFERDRALARSYRWVNPYAICRKFCGAHAYGETPLTTMNEIVDGFGVTEGDRLIECGAGRGRASLFLASYVSCDVIAYEEVPLFVEKLQRIAPPNLTVIQKNYLKEESFDADVIYLYGTMLEDDEISLLCDRFPHGAKIITVSFSLSEYSEEYKTVKTLQGGFPWGTTEVVWNERCAKES